MYAISLIDRTNLGLAAVAGMNQDLKLDGDKYTIIIMLFFVMYIIFESKSTSLSILASSFLTYSSSIQPHSPQSRSRKLALLHRRQLRRGPDRHGFHEDLCTDGRMPHASRHP